MDGLNERFGLTMSTGLSGSELAWSDFLRAVRVPDGQGDDAAHIASRLQAELDFGGRPFAHMLEELRTPDDAHVGTVTEIIRIVGPEVLVRVLAKLDAGERRRVVQASARYLQPAALVPLAQAVARTFDLPLSQPLLELVQKLAREAEKLGAGARERADQSFRGLIDHLVERWSESQVNSAATGFDAMFADAPRARSTIAPEPSRVIALSLESGAVGPVVWDAMKAESASEIGVRSIIDMVTRAPEGRATAMITEQITSPARLTSLLRESEIDFPAVDMMVHHLGQNATRPLIDELVESQNRATRRAIMDRLVQLGPDIAPLVLERLNDRRWYVVRNMITLLRECRCEVDAAAIDPFLSHEDARVRREMLQLRMDAPATRDTAIAQALQDKDKHVLRAALQTARAGMPPAAVPILARRVLEPDYPAEFRVMSLYLLGRTNNVAALDSLYAFAFGGKSLLGKPKLAVKTPEMLAALSGLARSWQNDRRARELIEVAEKSKDPQILNALQAVAGGE